MELALQSLIVLVAIFWGARLGGVGLGVTGGLGLVALVFCFGLIPTQPPIDVLLMILAVVTASSALQAAGGLDYLIALAERLLRNHPTYITYLGPIVAYAMTLFVGTGHVSYAILPIIAEVARETNIRPERPLSVAVIASQQAITASPISAATVALLGLTSGYDVRLMHILLICIPSTLLGILVAAAVMNRVGKDLDRDPEYQERMRSRDFVRLQRPPYHASGSIPTSAKVSVGVFLMAVVSIVLLGSHPQWRLVGPEGSHLLELPIAIELMMLAAAAVILTVGKVRPERIPETPVFKAGTQAVIAIFGIAWLGDTFFQGNIEVLGNAIRSVVTVVPWLFACALFVLSVLLYSQAATVRALMPFGLSLGIPVPSLIAMFPAVNGYFFIPNYPTIIAAIQFDSTGTTKIGRWVLNHSFMLPGLIAVVISVSCGFVLSAFVF